MMTEAQPAGASIGGIAAVLQAIAWPIVAVLFFIIYRSKLGALFDVFAQKLKEAKHVKAGNFEIEAAEAINQVANQAGQSASVQADTKGIPEDQIEAARLMGKRLNAVPIAFSRKVDVVERSMSDLIDQYESVRRDMRSGPSRTRLMNEITAKIRAYAIVALPLLPSLMEGSRAGERLAAICILQVKPDAAYFYWLVERVKKEDQAFLLYHASLALLALVKANPYLNRDDAARTAVHAALDHVESFTGGPDANTVEVLTEVLSHLEKQEQVAHT